MLATEEQKSEQELTSSLYQKTSNVGNKMWTAIKWSGIFVIGVVSAASAAYTLSQGLALLNIIGGPISSALLMNIVGYIFAVAIIGAVATGLAYGGYKIYQKYKKKNKKYEINPKEQTTINTKDVQNIQSLPVPGKESIKQEDNKTNIDTGTKNSQENNQKFQQNIIKQNSNENLLNTSDINKSQQKVNTQ